MRLRAIELRNWACIESLTLPDLHDGIIVMHGPNRTGKSSLVQALRSGLFDHFHDSQDSTLLAAIPWRTKAAPHVAIEFEHTGVRYRITKTFAKTKEGQAILEEQHSSGWTVLERGKEAAKRVRDLLGVEFSKAGVLQMLWLGQRDFQLPKPEAIDPTLVKALEAVLGTLITGRDIDFKARLDKACERWFTVKTMKDKKDSPVTKLTRDLEDARTAKMEIDRQWTEAESALKQYDEALARQPELRRALDNAETDLQRIQKECEGVRQRKSQYELAVKNLQQCERLHRQADQQREDFDEAARQLEAAAKQMSDLQLELRTADETRAQAERASAVGRKAVEDGDQRLAQHQLNRASLENRQRLIANRLEQESIGDKLHQVKDLEKQRQELEQKLSGPVVFSEQQIQDAREMRERISGVRANLQAEEIQVSIRVEESMQVQITRDGEATEKIDLAPTQDRQWLIRQRAAIQIGDSATVRVGRGQKDHDLETLARELAELESSLHATLSAAELDPRDPAAIDQLVARRFQHEATAKQLKQLRGSIVKSAPNGIPSLEVQLQQKRDEQQIIITGRPELADWEPDQLEVDGLRFDFDQHESGLQSIAHDAKLGLKQLNEMVATATKAERALRESIAGHVVQVQGLTQRVGACDPAVLLHECDQAKARHTEAQATVLETTLSEGEHAIETQFLSVRSAHANRSERLRSNEILLAELRVKLVGTEGLHQKRSQAEQAVSDLDRDWQRETLHAHAHRHLKELFELVRQDQVRRTVGPINDRVMAWAKQLGLADYTGLAFGNQLLPAGLVLQHATDGESVGLESESFGTLEQLSLLIRLAVGGLLAQNEPNVAILDDPLAHADLGKHRKMIEILGRAAAGEPHGPHPTGPLQLIVLTCHEDRFDYLSNAQHFDLAQLIRRGG